MVIGRTPEETYWEFFRADRSRDAKAWAAVMRYPHVRVAAPGRIEYFQTAEKFAASADWTQREATGWVRTEGIEPRVIHSSHDKVHLAGGWVRYNAENDPILSNRVVYVLTRIQGSWGVQARFACGAISRWQDAEDQDASKVVIRFLELLNDGYIGTIAGVVRFPFVVVGLDNAKIAESDASLISFLHEINLTPYEIDRAEVIQNGESGANVAISVRGDDRRVIHALFLIAKSQTSRIVTAVSVVTE